MPTQVSARVPVQVAGLDRVRAPVLDLSSATSVLSTGTFLLPACIKPVNTLYPVLSTSRLVDAVCWP